MHTELFEGHNPFAGKLVRNHAFVPLIRAVQRDKRIPSRDLARSVGLTRSFLYRLFNGSRILTEEHIQSLFFALGIDRGRAYIAVIELGDWRRYDDPNVILVSDLVQVFIPDLDRERTGAIVAKLPAAAIKHLSSQLTTAIVQNDREVAERRDRLAVNGGRA
ncbi:helix-turn-helix transcriptional regulator [Sphingomonas sp. SUN039]|uniref:helix-turn-helix domain-containing protein n=1 Tax=Sphingomonas sp. SUN039 TaxID=2937787 RepID=UPI00216493EE|nr:helix-turn-helix transcriptional regulator [Sphingomonas sp. SUN039]UVO53805.1 helix-turn-helix transcriptional regulator [Sphingomonas sp. SUN039]